MTKNIAKVRHCRSKSRTARPMVEPLENRRLLDGTVASSTSVSISADVIAVGGTDTFTAVVVPTTSTTGAPVPTGTVEFFSYNGTYPTQTVDLDSTGTATLTLTGTTPGYMAFIAEYSGDTTYTLSESNPGTVTVNAQSIEPELTRNTIPASILQNAVKRRSTTVELTNPTDSQISGSQVIDVSAMRYLGGSFASTVVGSITRNVTLDPGASRSYTVPINMTLADTTAGSYSLNPTATNASGLTSFEIAPAATVNPIVTVVQTYVDLSDLISNVTRAVLPGHRYEISLEIFNHGNIPAVGLVDTALSLSSNADGSSPTSVDTVTENLRIAVNGHETFHIIKTEPVGSVPGSFYWVANLNSDAEFAESDFTNNMAISPTALIVEDPYPNILGGYQGTWVITRGPDKGTKYTQIGIYLTEDDTTGAWTSSTTSYVDGIASTTVTDSGTITPAGVLVDLTDTVTGRLVRDVIRGKFKYTTGALAGDSGTYVWTLTG